MNNTGRITLLNSLLCLALLALCQCKDTPMPAPEAGQAVEFPMNDAIWNDLHAQLDSGNARIYVEFAAGNYEWMRQWYLHWQSIIPAMSKFREDSLVRYTRASIQGSLGNAQALTGDVENGLKNLLEGVASIEKEYGPKSLDLLDGCVGIGSCYALRGDYESAIYWQYKGIEMSQRIFPPGHYVFAKWHFNIGYYRSRQGDFPAALQQYEQAIDIYNQSGYKKSLAYTYERAANAALQLHDFNKAHALLTLGDAALAFATNRPDNDRAMLLLGKAAWAMAQRQLASAASFLKDAETVLATVSATKSSAWSDYYTLKGDLAFKTGKLDEAIDDYNQAITGKYQQAVQCFAVESQSAGYVINQELLNKIAALYLQKGDTQHALAILQDMLNKAGTGQQNYREEENPRIDELPHCVMLVTTLHLKARAYERMYNHSGRREDLHIALATYRLTAFFIDKLNRGLRWENSKFTLEARAMPFYESAISFFLQLEKQEHNGVYLQEAWELADRCKAITLQEQLAKVESQQFPGMPDAFVRRERSLREDVAFLEQQVMGLKNQATQGRGSATAPPGQSLLDYQTRLLAAKDRYAALLDSLESADADLYKLRYASPAATLPQIRGKVLKNNTFLVEFFAGDSSLYIFGLDAKGIKYHIEPLDSSLNRQIRLVSAIATDTHQSISDFRDAARALYLRLLAPVLPAGKPGEKLLVIPDGLLGHLPFHVLLDSDAGIASGDWRTLPYLLTTTCVRYEYSAAMLLSPSRNGVSGNIRPKLYAGFAPAYTGGTVSYNRSADSLVVSRAFPDWRGGAALPDLRFNRPEVEEAAKTLEGESYVTDQATEGCFKQAAPNYKILHLAMHACVDDVDPLYSQFVFSPATSGDTTEDGRLHVYELYNLRLRAVLAVLSACQTGAGKEQRGEGIISLSRAFKYAGCPNVIMSLWNADDAAAKRIMGRFFDNLKNGLGKDAALADAQRAFLQEATKEEGHPARWATFVLIGDDTPVIIPLQNWLVAGLTGLVSLGILYLFFFKMQRHRCI